MDTPSTTPVHTSPIKTSRLVRILAILLILVLVFWAGMAVGYHKAEFSYRFSDNYFRTFGNRGHGPGGMMGIGDPDQLIGGHGAVGKVLSATLPTLIISDRDGTEKNITVTNQTIIRSARSEAASTTIKADDFVVVIGTPDSSGHITAKLIRIMPFMPPHASTSPTRQNMMYVR